MVVAPLSIAYAAEPNFANIKNIDFQISKLRDCLKSYSHPNLQDLCVLNKAINFFHPNVNFSFSKEQYSEKLRLLTEISPTLSEQEFTLHLAEFVAKINDSHTYISFNKMKTTNLPISLQLEKGEINIKNINFIGYSTNPHKLIKVNDDDASSLIKKYSNYFPLLNKKPNLHDAANYLLVIYQLHHPNAKTILNIEYGDNKSLFIDLEELKKGKQTSKITEKKKKQCKFKNYFLLTISNFTELSSLECIKEIQHYLNENYKINKKLIIDLRDNGGGSLEISKELSKKIFGIDIFKNDVKAAIASNVSKYRVELLATLFETIQQQQSLNEDLVDKIKQNLESYPIDKRIDEEINLILAAFDNITVINSADKNSSQEYLLVKSNSHSALTDHDLNIPIYILTNENTRSAASLFALYAQKYIGAKVIGTGIGGDRKNFGSPQKVILPNLDLPIYISTQYLISNHVENYQDIQWPSPADNAIVLDHYLDSPPSGSLSVIVESLINQGILKDN